MTLDSGNQQTITPDTQAPELTSGSIATNGQNASTGLAAASVEATIEDNGSGLDWGRLTYTSSLAPDQTVSIDISDRNLVDGNNNSGQYTSSNTFHKNAANGTWNLTQAEFHDETGKWSILDNTNLNSWITENGFTSLASFNLASSSPDTVDPVLSKVILGGAHATATCE
jgi:hypothetical protein